MQLLMKAPIGERYLLVGENVTYRRAFTEFTKAFGSEAPSIALRPWMLHSAWRLERVRSWLTGSTPFVTEATAHSAVIERGYSAAKVEALLGLRFRTVAEMAENMGSYFEVRKAH